MKRKSRGIVMPNTPAKFHVGQIIEDFRYDSPAGEIIEVSHSRSDGKFVDWVYLTKGGGFVQERDARLIGPCDMKTMSDVIDALQLVVTNIKHQFETANPDNILVIQIAQIDILGKPKPVSPSDGGMFAALSQIPHS